jgi:Zn-dependent hydrolases, including glyoxylases
VRISEPGKVSDRIEFLGTRKICLYLLKDKDAMIIGGGMSLAIPFLEKQFSAMDFDPGRIKYLVIPHSHFDHCGAVPYLRRKFPQMQILASAYSKEVFSKEKVVSSIAGQNQHVIESLGLQDKYKGLNWQFDGIQVDRVVAENDVTDLGDEIKVQFIETPGHTRCSIATYVPKLKAIFPSDSAPFPTEDGSEFSYPSAQYDFPLYTESLRKLAAYEVEICAFDHHGVIIGNQAHKVLQQGLEQTEKFKNYIMEQYQKIGDQDKIAQKLAAEAVNKNKFDFLGLELEATVARAVVHRILG